MMMAMTIEERSKDNDPQKDPWADWRPSAPHRQQEKHSPTEPVVVRLSASRETQTAQRRLVDARLWDAMTPQQQNAACIIAFAFETMGKGLGYVSSNWQRIPGCHTASNAGEAHGRLIQDYILWSTACAKAKISHAMVIDVLCFGFSCRMIDRDRRQTAGTTRRNLMEGLDLYCKMRGW